MAENSNSIKPAVKETGFFTKSGQLKGKEQLKEKIEVKSDNQEAASSSEVVGKALSKVDDRFREEVSSVASDVNRRAAQLKQNKESLKKEKQTLQDLKQAYEDNNTDRAEELKAQLKEQRDERTQSQEQIKREQRLSSDERSIRLGDKEKGRVKVPELKLREVEKEIPDKAKDVKEQLKKVNDDIENLNSQKDDIKAARKVLDETLNSGREDIAKISENSLKSIDSAQQSASKISSDAKTLTRDELLASVAGKINPASVAQALRS